MDNFAYEKMWMMNIGDVKGAIVDAEIEKTKPQVMTEIGAFCGYSAVRFANKLRSVSGSSAHFYSFEFLEHFVNIAKQIVDLAGLSDVVTFFVGPFSETYAKLKELGINHVDIFFIDHDKRQYLNDFKIIERIGLLKPEMFFSKLISLVFNCSYLTWTAGSYCDRRQCALARPGQTTGLPEVCAFELQIYIRPARVVCGIPSRAQGRR